MCKTRSKLKGPGYLYKFSDCICLTVDLGLPDAVRDAPQGRQYVENVVLANRRTPQHQRQLNAHVNTHTCNQPHYIRPHRMQSKRMRPIVADVASSECLLVTTVASTKTAEPIKVQFEAWSRVGPSNHVAARISPRKVSVWGRFPLPANVKYREYPACSQYFQPYTKYSSDASFCCQNCNNLLCFSFFCIFYSLIVIQTCLRPALRHIAYETRSRHVN